MVNLENVIWRSGYRHFVRGNSLDYCPYEKASKEWDLWISGYSAAEFNTRY